MILGIAGCGLRSDNEVVDKNIEETQNESLPEGEFEKRQWFNKGVCKSLDEIPYVLAIFAPLTVSIICQFFFPIQKPRIARSDALLAIGTSPSSRKTFKYFPDLRYRCMLCEAARLLEL